MARGGRGRSGPKRGPLARLNPSPQVYFGNPIGVASGADYIWGTHAAAIHAAEGLKSQIFESLVSLAVVVTAVPALIVAPQQAYADVNQSAIFEPLSGRQGPTVRAFVGGPLQVDLTQQGWIETPTAARQGAVPPIRQGAPQVVDLTQQGWLLEPTPGRQGAVPQLAVGDPQDDPSQIEARLTPSQPAAPITPNPIAGFFSVPPQNEERPTRAVWPSQAAGKTPRVIAPTSGAPQLYDFTQQAVLIPPSVAPPVVSYALRSWYAAPQLVDLTQQGWVRGTAPGRQAKVPPLIRGGQPQFNPYQIPADLCAPLEGSVFVAAPDGSVLRTYSVQPQDRVLAIAIQDRCLTIELQDRVLGIPPQDRAEDV